MNFNHSVYNLNDNLSKENNKSGEAFKINSPKVDHHKLYHQNDNVMITNLIQLFQNLKGKRV